MENVKWYSSSQASTAKHVSYPQLTATPSYRLFYTNWGDIWCRVTIHAICDKTTYHYDKIALWGCVSIFAWLIAYTGVSDMLTSWVKGLVIIFDPGGKQHFTGKLFAPHSARGQRILRPTRHHAITFRRHSWEGMLRQWRKFSREKYFNFFPSLLSVHQKNFVAPAQTFSSSPPGHK